MCSSPKVSVLIPTYNYAEYLPETLESVFDQDLQDIEVIVADDHSDDDTVEVMETLRQKFTDIQFYRHETNKGMVENWNWCLSRARGSYVILLLADDKFNHPSALRMLSEALDDHPEAALAVSSRCIIDAHSHPVEVKNPLGKKDRVIPSDFIFKTYLNRDPQIVNPIGEPTAVLFRKNLAHRGFHTEYSQLVDMEMWCHLLQKGNLIYFSEPLCCFRCHQQQQTKRNQKTYRHQKEEINLCRSYTDPSVLKYVLFQKIYRISKIKSEVLKDTVKDVRNMYRPFEYAFYYLRYKLKRRSATATSIFRKVLSVVES